MTRIVPRFLTALLLTLPLALCAQNDNFIFNSFKQGSQKGAGNCASVAAIKVAIATYGSGNVFKILKNESKQTYTALLRSGKTVLISFAEMKEGIAQNAFRDGSDDFESRMIRMYADTCFAVMCKNLQNTPELHGRKNKDNSFANACKDLNNGFKGPDAPVLLGLKVKTFRSTLKQIRSKANAVMYNRHHGAYTSYGLYDAPGDPGGIRPIEKFRWNYAGYKCLFLFCGPCGSYELDTNEFERSYFDLLRQSI